MVILKSAVNIAEHHADFVVNIWASKVQPNIPLMKCVLYHFTV